MQSSRRFQLIRDKITDYITATDELALLDKAYKMAEVMCLNEHRLDGRNWLDHNLDMLQSAVDLRLDVPTLCATLLYDSYRFGLFPEEIKNELGGEVAELIQALNELKDIGIKHRQDIFDESYQDYLRRIIIMVGQDVRAVVVRLISKYHGIRTGSFLPEEKKNIAINKVFFIYAPIAEQLGMHELRRELESHAFKLQNPEEYAKYLVVINHHYFASPVNCQKLHDSLTTTFAKRNISIAKLEARLKSVYSLYQKTQRYALKYVLSPESALAKITDIYAMRIITTDIPSCYEVLKLLHNDFKFVDDATDDYIVNPKPSGYQSIHTSILVDDVPVEVQIKTLAMHEAAECGLANHSFYKVHGSEGIKLSESKLCILKKLNTWRENFYNDKVILKTNDLEDELLVFTPKGDVVALPYGSTPVDFAFSLHTTLGITCVGALIDNVPSPLATKLKSGNVVEIVTDSSQKRPPVEWFEFVKSKAAKYNIKKTLRT